ncbi:MAG: CBS domain-containing protein [Planctomycetota bacterium]
MGEQIVLGNPKPEDLRHFMKCLLNDVWALETMLRRGMVESGVRRIGAEQEIVLVEAANRPAMINLQVLEALKDSDFTTELPRFNVEVNFPPLPFSGGSLRQLEGMLIAKVEKLRGVVRSLGADVVLCGILPTLRVQDIGLHAMTPYERYRALNDALSRLRGDPYELRINGADELIIKHDSVMLEACNTSFQVHLQVDPDDFARSYNLAQLLAAPTLAVAVNSPVLFGRRLWKETRVAVFQQAVDTRTSSYFLQDHSSRVHFGRRWVQRSALELFQEDISRFRVLLGTGNPPVDPFQELAEGRTPRLGALQLHNSTVYRWNRACYGISEGKPHLRIENRVLPAGPTIHDEVANAAFWLGLMNATPRVYGDVKDKLAFENVRANFVAAARRGLGAQLTWLNGTMIPVTELILTELLPLARSGLEQAKIDTGDIDRYLGTIEARVKSRQTGAQWQLSSLEAMQGRGTLSQQLTAITATTITHQVENVPVHEWPLASLAAATRFKESYARIDQIMTTDVFTVNQEELLELVARIMDWNNIRYVPVEDDKLQLVGLISHRAMLRYLARDCTSQEGKQIPVKQIMHKVEDDLITVGPDCSTLDALELMRTHRVGCLPVVKDGRLAGIATERDFMRIAAQLLEHQLRTPNG